MKILHFILSTFLLVGCQSGADQVQESSESLPNVQQPNESSGQKVNDRKIVKNGSVLFETENIGETKSFILETAAKYDVLITGDNINNYDERRSNTIVLKVKPSDFDNILNDITTQFKQIENQHVSIKDVTLEMIDLEARIKVKKELEEHYLELLKSAKTINETLLVEADLAKIREVIESVEGRYNYLKNQIAFSTLTVEFYERVPQYLSLKGEFSRSLINGWVKFVSFFYLLLSIWPFVLIGGLIFWIVSSYKK